MSGDWRHRLYARDEAVERGPDDPRFCACGEPWPCDAEQQRLRADGLDVTLRRVLEAAEFRRPRFDESGDAWLKARDSEWMDAVKVARALLATPVTREGGEPNAESD